MEIDLGNYTMFSVFYCNYGKSTLFMYLFSGLYILYEKKKISLRPIIFGALFLILLIPTMYFYEEAQIQILIPTQSSTF